MKAKLRQKKCKTCGEKFSPWNSLQIACSATCALAEGKKRMEKREKQKLKLMKEALKTRGDWIKEAQKAFNAYIRERDRDQACISCDKPAGGDNHLTGSGWDAGHYRSTGSAPHMRFEEENCHKQCVKCNQHLSGNTVEYRKRLIDRIGLERVEAIEADQEPRKHTIPDLKEMIDHYKKMVRELKKKRESIC